MVARSVIAAGALAVVLAACTHDPFDRDYGTATIAWTIDGRADPDRCALHDARFVRVVLREGEHAEVSDRWVPCRDLDVRFVLRRGWYGATITLADATYRAISTVRTTGSFYVDGDRDVLVVVDITPSVIEPASRGDVP